MTILTYFAVTTAIALLFALYARWEAGHISVRDLLILIFSYWIPVFNIIMFGVCVKLVLESKKLAPILGKRL
jgi:hypothetical protein